MKKEKVDRKQIKAFNNLVHRETIKELERIYETAFPTNLLNSNGVPSMNNLYNQAIKDVLMHRINELKEQYK